MNKKPYLSRLEEIGRDLAQEIIEKPEEIRRTNRTKELQQYLEWCIQNGELINIAITGKPRRGKSTIMLTLVWTIMQLLKKHKKTKQKFSLNLIASEQIEFSRKVQDQTLQNCCIGTDEYQTLSSGGLNAATEEQYLDQFYKIQAVRQIHRIGCQPTEIHDEMSDIQLDVLGKTKGTTRTYIYYNTRNPNTGKTAQIIGYADINVAKTLKQKWYKEYETKKEKRIQLTNDYAVRDLRDIEQAELILATYKRLEKSAAAGAMTTTIIKSYLQLIRTEQKRFLGILATNDLEDKTRGLIDTKTSILKTKKELEKTKNLKRKTQTTQEEIQGLTTRQKELEKALKTLKQYYQKMIKLREEYFKTW